MNQENLKDTDSDVVIDIDIYKFRDLCKDEYTAVVLNRYNVIRIKSKFDIITATLPRKEATMFLLKYSNCILKQRSAYVYSI